MEAGLGQGRMEYACTLGRGCGWGGRRESVGVRVEMGEAGWGFQSESDSKDG